ncbi:hypothetical protein E2C01_054870 [Portunus trituberculatus]|uniref:Uncharacterized protein n=1 Tax=Portunus trituberculatus TaxID=210409 RepID=A0A5B7GT78_PORTR|nr:hypothetical protein [Portunus trituberculatus]
MLLYTDIIDLFWTAIKTGLVQHKPQVPKVTTLWNERDPKMKRHTGTILTTQQEKSPSAANMSAPDQIHRGYGKLAAARNVEDKS